MKALKGKVNISQSSKSTEPSDEKQYSASKSREKADGKNGGKEKII